MVWSIARAKAQQLLVNNKVFLVGVICHDLVIPCQHIVRARPKEFYNKVNLMVFYIL